jgi:predicted dehydrogenase
MSGGGVLMDLGSHAIDLFHYIFEDIDPHDLCSQVIVPDRDKGPAYFTPFYVFSKVGHQKQHEHRK